MNVIFRYQVAVAPATLVTIVVIATLRIIRTAQGAVDGAGPVTDRTHGVLEPHVEGESPLSITEGVAVHLCLTRRTLEQTSLPCRSTLPEPAAVWAQERVRVSYSNNFQNLLLECSW